MLPNARIHRTMPRPPLRVMRAMARVLSYFPVTVFLVATAATQHAPTAFIWAGLTAVVQLLVGMRSDQPTSRLILGINLWLISGAAASLAQQDWWLELLRDLRESALFASIVAVGIITTLCTRSGFVGIALPPAATPATTTASAATAVAGTTSAHAPADSPTNTHTSTNPHQSPRPLPAQQAPSAYRPVRIASLVMLALALVALAASFLWRGQIVLSAALPLVVLSIAQGLLRRWVWRAWHSVAATASTRPDAHTS